MEKQEVGEEAICLCFDWLGGCVLSRAITMVELESVTSSEWIGSKLHFGLIKKNYIWLVYLAVQCCYDFKFYRNIHDFFRISFNFST